VGVKADKESRCTIGVDVPQEPAIIYILGDVDNRGEGYINVGGIVYSKEKTCGNLDN